MQGGIHSEEAVVECFGLMFVPLLVAQVPPISNDILVEVTIVCFILCAFRVTKSGGFSSFKIDAPATYVFDFCV